MLKTLMTIAFLGAIGVGLWVYLNDREPPAPPAGAADTAMTPPDIDLGGLGGDSVGPTAISPGGIESGPPDFSASAVTGSAPSATMPPAVGSPSAATPPVSESQPTASMTDRFQSPTVPSAMIPPTAGYAPPSGPAAGLGQGSSTNTIPSGAAATIPPNSLGGLSSPSPSAPSATLPTSENLPIASPSSYSLSRKMAGQYLASQKLAEALALLTRWYGDSSLTPQEAQELDQLLGQLAGTVIYSREHHLEPAYQVKQGETLETIAQAYDIPWELLARINGLQNPTDVIAGQELKVLRGPFSATVSLDRKEMIFMVDRCYAGRYPIEVGQDRQIVEGNWQVNQKQANPTYYGAAGMVDANDPSNPLGEFMVGLANSQGGVTAGPFGIHGSPTTGASDSRGFIRLSPQAAEEAHRILSVGSRVTIRR